MLLQIKDFEAANLSVSEFLDEVKVPKSLINVII